MLKIIILRSRGVSDLSASIELKSEEEIRLVSDLVIAGWHTIPYRNPKAFGAKATLEKEIQIEYIFMKACRITFEHMMMMQTIPERFVKGINIEELNQFIKDQLPKVKVFWEQLICVDIQEINKVTSSQLISSCVIRIQDLDLLFSYAENY